MTSRDCGANTMPSEAITWCLRRNADGPTCDRLRAILPAVEAADATNRALVERVADLEKEVARLSESHAAQLKSMRLAAIALAYAAENVSLYESAHEQLSDAIDALIEVKR